MNCCDLYQNTQLVASMKMKKIEQYNKIKSLLPNVLMFIYIYIYITLPCVCNSM